MSTTVETGTHTDTHHDDHDHGPQGFWSKYIFATDHSIIGLQYMFTGIFMALVGGFMVYVFRMQLAWPGESVPFFGTVSPGEYNSLVTNHGTIMIFWVAMPILLAAFGNLLIPIMIGADDMVFPRVNRLSYQIFFLSTVILFASFFVPGGGFGGGWTLVRRQQAIAFRHGADVIGGRAAQHIELAAFESGSSLARRHHFLATDIFDLKNALPGLIHDGDKFLQKGLRQHVRLLQRGNRIQRLFRCNRSRRHG